MRLILIFFLFFLVSFSLKAQDTVFLAKCEAVSSTKYEYDEYILVHTILQMEDTILLIQEFYNNSNRVVFVQPKSNAASLNRNNVPFLDYVDENKCCPPVLNFFFEAENNDDQTEAPLLLPNQKIRYFYTFVESETLIDFNANREKKENHIQQVGANFSFFEYPLHIPIYNFINKPFMRGKLNRWHQNIKGINMQYISLFCTIPEK